MHLQPNVILEASENEPFGESEELWKLVPKCLVDSHELFGSLLRPFVDLLALVVRSEVLCIFDDPLLSLCHHISRPVAKL